KVLEENNIKGALQNARDAYDDLFSLWLPYYTDIKQDEFALHKTLLYIMTTLEDTNIYYRKGIQRAKQVQKEAKELLENFSCFALEKMNKDYIKDNVSPGGAADMLSLTLFIESLL
ncbi:MAG: triphosphoribosyl-dephospho-CoA synthase, partial [Bacteroidales bacterium]|nr:triphosphoribosyl-dephospho-CoA synthase [Bacteroidales bacterium]